MELEAIEKILVEGGTDEAIRLLDEYITSAPEPSDRAYYLLGNAHRKKGDWRMAINNYLEAMAINPESQRLCDSQRDPGFLQQGYVQSINNKVLWLK